MLLAIDTSAHLCAVSLYDNDQGLTVGESVKDIGRGHAELLMGQIEACLAEANATYSDIKRIGVVVGPGSFTGVRVGMATARGLRLALNINAIGISSLEACEAAALESGFEGRFATILDARRGQVYCKISDQKEPFIEAVNNLATRLPSGLSGLCGSGSRLLQEHSHSDLPVIHEHSAPPIEMVAKLAASAISDGMAPEPLYLRSADAKPQSGFALKIA